MVGEQPPVYRSRVRRAAERNLACNPSKRTETAQLHAGDNMTKDVLPASPSEPSTTSQHVAEPATEEGALIYKNILVPIHFSEHSTKTVHYATRLASQFDASVSWAERGIALAHTTIF